MSSAWSSRKISREEAESFAASAGVGASEQRVIAETLCHFPVECEVRGMFFDGLVDVVVAQKGKEAAAALQSRARVGSSRVAFSLYPHRDFYKLFFLAAPALHPGVPLENALGRVAETFYPVFRASMLGRTMSALMGSDPAGIVRRLSDAYRLSIPWNEHEVQPDGARSLLWRAKVEPCPLYPAIFSGIVAGTMRSHGVSVPRVEVLASSLGGSTLKATFRVGW